MTAPHEQATDVVTGLLAALALQPRGADDRGQDLFTAPSQPQPWGRAFGGQVLGQAIVAASRTVPSERLVHSMHGYFLRPGDSAAPVDFAVERLRDGRSFTARRVHALQDDVPILSMIASFQTQDDGPDHAEPAPDVPGPEDLPTAADLVGHVDHPTARHWAHGRPVDVRHVDAPVYLAPARDREPRQAAWLRTVGPLPDDPVLHRAVLAYASDYTILESAMRRHGIAWATPGFKAASLDHAMWWHRPARADEWLLYVTASPSASGARGLGLGRIFSRDGRLVASVAQEGMLRLPAT